MSEGLIKIYAILQLLLCLEAIAYQFYDGELVHITKRIYFPSCCSTLLFGNFQKIKERKKGKKEKRKKKRTHKKTYWAWHWLLRLESQQQCNRARRISLLPPPLFLENFILDNHKFTLYFFLRRKLMDFINLIQLYPIVKSKQYVMGHLPSILENLVCIMHFQLDYKQPYCHFS